MKKIIGYLTLIAMISITSCEKDPPIPSDLTASQGTYVGVVHIAYASVSGDGEIIYEAFRFNEDNAEWQGIGSSTLSNWDDYGYKLIDNKIEPGKKYRYKVQSNDDNGESGKSNEVSGYAFIGEVAEITSINKEIDGDDVDLTINWTDNNNRLALKNLTYTEYKVQRIENGNYADMSCVHTEYSDDFSKKYFSYKDSYLKKDIEYSYLIETYYYYTYHDCNGVYNDGAYYKITGEAVNDTSGNNTNPTVDYITDDLGQIVAATSDNTILDIQEKVVNGNVYVGAIIGSTIFGGTPSLYKLNGSSWQNVWTCDALNKSMRSYFAVNSSGESYIAGSCDSLCIYKHDGSVWSNDIAPDGINGLWGIEVFNDELYLIAEFEALRVLKYNGSTWEIIGGDIASGSIFNIDIENIGGSLYINYEINDNLYIKHLNGTSWTQDLQWSQEWLSKIGLAKNGSDLYFSTSTSSISDYPGGVYRVTSATTVENLIPDGAGDSWFIQGAFTMSIDSDGNIIVSSTNAEKISNTEIELYPYLIQYDGTEWSTIKGNYKDGVGPIGLSTLGTDIYYMYGDEVTANAAKQATVLKSKKLTK
jgi:hypothetical protein